MRLRPCSAARAGLLRFTLVTGALALTLSGCSGGSAHRDPAPSPSVVITSDPALDAASAALRTSRTTVLDDVAAITAAASALDGVDTQAARGAFDPARQAQPAAVSKAAAATAALGELPAALATYTTGIDRLAAETNDPELSSQQVAAVGSLAGTARQEDSAVTTFRAAASRDWSAYRQLAAAQALWISRAGAGYYPDTNNDLYDPKRAGGAYIVLVNPFRSALTAEREALAGGSAALTAARAATERALGAASNAFP